MLLDVVLRLFSFLWTIPVALSLSFSGTIDLGKASLGISLQNGNIANSLTGEVITNIGDFNGDGYDDIGIKSNCSFFVVFGTYDTFAVDLTSLTSSTGFSIDGSLAHQACSLSNIAGIGDINGDNFDDIILVFAQSGGDTINPTYYILFGGISPQNINLDQWTTTMGIFATPSTTSGIQTLDTITTTSTAEFPKRKKFQFKDAFLFQNNSQKSGLFSQEEIERQLEEERQLQKIDTEAVSYYYYSHHLHCPDPITIETGNAFLPLKQIDLFQFYFPLSYTGDINGDGYNDVMMVGDISTLESNFTIYVLYGSDNLSSSIVLESLTEEESFKIIADGKSFPVYSYSQYISINTTFTCLENDTIRVETNFYYNISHIYRAIAITSAGDVNNDGYEDLLIGSGFGYTMAGLSFLIYGRNSTGAAALTLSALTKEEGYSIIGAGRSNAVYSGDYSGFAVGGGMDFNNDGYSDLLIGAPAANSYYGAVYVIYGATTKRKELRLTALTHSQGIAIYSTTSASLGTSVSSVGDFNEDSIDDIIIGAPYGAGGTGIAYIVYGGTSLVNMELNSLVAPAQAKVILGVKSSNPYAGDSNTGSFVSGGGDFNRDGIPDVLIGAPYQPVGQNGIYANAGAGYVIFGTKDESSPLSLRYLSAVATFITKGSPLAVSIPGDLNQDGYLDITIGSFLNDQTFLVYGHSTGFVSESNLTKIQASDGIILTGVTGSWFGFATASGHGDFNGDGIQDFIVGAPSSSSYEYSYPSSVNTNPQPALGAPPSAVYVIYGQKKGVNLHIQNLTSDRGTTIVGKVASGTGFSITGLGDFFADKNTSSKKDKKVVLSDIAIGAPYYDSYHGEVYILRGRDGGYNETIDLSSKTSCTENGVITIRGENMGDYTGWAVSSTDFNGDGIPDLVIGAPGAGYTSQGTTTDQKPTPSIEPESSYSYYSSREIANSGLVYVIFGQFHLPAQINLTQPMNSSYGFTIFGAMAYEFMGSAVAGIGDVNGDGYADIAIGSPFASEYAGCVYIVFGSPTVQDIYLAQLASQRQGITITGTAVSDYAGFSVSYGGDVNGDGFADIYLGAPGYNNLAGATFFVFGGRSLPSSIALASLTTSQGLTITQDTLYMQAGYSLASLTDSKGNVMTLLGNNPSQLGVSGESICYAVVPQNPANNHTINPTARPTFYPTFLPTVHPTLMPSPVPTFFPSLAPTPSPTAPPFWAQNGDVILGIAIPAALSFVPIYFSKQICFYVLEHWSSANRRRGLVQIFFYGACKKVFLADFVEAMETKEKKKELDEHERLTEKSQQAVGSNIELKVLKKLKQSSESGTSPKASGEVENPLIQAEEGRAPATFRQSYLLNELESFRKSSVNIDSDDEAEDGQGTETDNGSGRSPALASNNERRYAVAIPSSSSRGDTVIKAVYSIHYDHPEVQALYQGQLLLVNAPIQQLLQEAMVAATDKGVAISVVPVLEPATDNLLLPLVTDSMEDVPTPVKRNPSYFPWNIMDHWSIYHYFWQRILFPWVGVTLTSNHRLSRLVTMMSTSFSQSPLSISVIHWLVGMVSSSLPSEKRVSLREGLYWSSLHSLAFAVRSFALSFATQQYIFWASKASLMGLSTTTTDVMYCIGWSGIYSTYCYSLSSLFPAAMTARMIHHLPHLSLWMSNGLQCYSSLQIQQKSFSSSSMSVSVSRLNELLPLSIDALTAAWVVLATDSSYTNTIATVVLTDTTVRAVLTMIPEAMKLQWFDEYLEEMGTSMSTMMEQASVVMTEVLMKEEREKELFLW